MAVFLVNQCTFSKLPNVSSNDQQTNQQQPLGANGTSQTNPMTNGVGVGITSSNICGLKFDSLFELIHHIEDNHIRDVDYTSNTPGPFFNGSLQQPQQAPHIHGHPHHLHHPLHPHHHSHHQHPHHPHPHHLHSHAHSHQQHPHAHSQQQQFIQQPTYSAQSNSTSSQNVTQIINGTWLPTSCILRIFNSTQKSMKQEVGDKNDPLGSPASQMFQQPQPSPQPNLQHHLQQRQAIQQQQPLTVEMLTPNQICSPSPVQAITIPTKMGLEPMSKTITVAGTGQPVNVVAKPGMMSATLVGSPAPSPHLVPAGQTMTPIHQTMQQPMAIQQAVITTQMQPIQPQQQHTIVSQTIPQSIAQTMQHPMHPTLQPQQYQIHQISQAPGQQTIQQAVTTGAMAAPIQAYSPIAAQLQASPMRPPTANVVYQQQQTLQPPPPQLQPQQPTQQLMQGPLQHHPPPQLLPAPQQQQQPTHTALHPAQAQSAPPQLQAQPQMQPQQPQPQPNQTQQSQPQTQPQPQQVATNQPQQSIQQVSQNQNSGSLSQPGTPAAIQKPTKIYKCTECNKPYKTMHGLRAHMSSKHPNATQTEVKAVAIMPDGSSDTPTGSPADFLPQTPSSQPRPSPQPASQPTQPLQQVVQQVHQTSLPQKQVKNEIQTQPQQQEQTQQQAPPTPQQSANAAE